MVSGVTYPGPGANTLAHNGVRFLDELSGFIRFLDPIDADEPEGDDPGDENGAHKNQEQQFLFSEIVLGEDLKSDERETE